MARYDMDYGRTYGLGYGERELFEPTPRSARSRSRPGGWRSRMRRREMGYGGEFGGREAMGYGREYMGRERPYYRTGNLGYGREYMGYGLGYGAYGAYDVDYRGAGYGREYRKSRWQTDYGDPFGDRERGAPIRVTRGAYGEYGEEFMAREGRRRIGGAAGPGYDVEYRPRRRSRY